MSTTNPFPRPTRDQLKTIAFVAAWFGVTDRTVRNWISKGLFPAYRIPGTRGIRLDPNEVGRALRMIPATVARAGTSSYGPNAKIIDLPPQAEVVPPKADA